MIYSSQSWNCTKKEIRKLEGLQYRQLRSIFGKTWKDRISHVQLLQSIKFGPNFNFNWAVSDEDKTKDPNLSSVETMIRLSRLRYCGHVLRMNDHRLPKQIMYSEADLGERSRGRPKKNFRGCIKEDLKHCNNGLRQIQLEGKDQLRGLFAPTHLGKSKNRKF